MSIQSLFAPSLTAARPDTRRKFVSREQKAREQPTPFYARHRNFSTDEGIIAHFLGTLHIFIRCHVFLAAPPFLFCRLPTCARGV